MFKILWDFNIQYDNIIEHRRTDIVAAEKKQNRCVIVDIVSLGKLRVHENEQEKMIIIRTLTEISRIWKTKHLEIVPAVVGDLHKKFWGGGVGLTANQRAFGHE